LRTTSFNPDQTSLTAHTLISTKPIGSARAQRCEVPIQISPSSNENVRQVGASACAALADRALL